jgi:hypothetical protein
VGRALVNAMQALLVDAHAREANRDTQRRRVLPHTGYGSEVSTVNRLAPGIDLRCMAMSKALS